MQPTKQLEISPLKIWDIRITRITFALITLEGLLALVTSLAIHSMERRTFIFGFSASRFVLEVLLAILVLGLLSIAVKSLTDTTGTRTFLAHLQKFIRADPAKAWTFTSSLFSAAIICFFLYIHLQFSLAQKAPSFTIVLFFYFSSVLVWATTSFLQLALLGIYLWRSSIPATIRTIIATPTEHLLPTTILLGALQCIILFLRSDLLFRIHGWFWKITPRPYSLTLLWLIPFFLFIFISVKHLITTSPTLTRNILLATTLVLLLQVAFGFAAGNGFESLRLKFINAPISHEVRTACEYQGDISSTIKHYEVNFSDDFWLGTKPPGLIVIFLIFHKSAEWFYGQNLSVVKCFDIVTKAMTFLFPVLASLVVFPLHDLTKLLGKQEYSLDAAILYMSAPAILLMPLIRDQAIFPLVAIFSLVVAVKAALTKSLPLAFLTGILLYISTFLSFSLLPIIALTYAFHIFIGFRDRDHIPPIRTVLLIGGITIGIIFMWSMGNSILSYNPIVRYQAALQHHSTNKDFVADLPHLMRYALTNSLEFVMAIGIPIFELFLVHGIQSLLRGVRKTASNMDIFTLATLGTLVVLQLAGQTQGETARLWLFMVPIVAIIASVPVRHMQAKTKIAFIMVFALQILLSVMTFMNMDFH